MSANCTEATGKAGIYVLYSVGLCVPVGLVRLVISVGFIVYHLLDSCSQDLALNERSRKRDQEDKEGDLGTWAWNKVVGTVDRGVTEGVKGLGKLDAPNWNEEALRGLAEFFFIGGIIYTGIDNLGSRHVSWLGLEELAEKINAELPSR